jgi:hypothetical protein
MARIKAKQISEFQDVGSGAAGTTGQYLAWDASTGKYTFQDQPIDGAKGSTGAKGDKGNTGADSTVAGPKGDKGSTGADSTVAGPKGDKGNTGADSTVAGPKGDKGNTGAKGDKGNTGAKGDKGSTGAKGDKGNTGQRGDDWSSGLGEPITPGQQEGDHYLDTETGNVYYWSGAGWEDSGNIQGPQGDKGSTGAKGNTGAKGDKGSTGAKGDKGNTGAKGDKGNTGTQGDKGNTGTQGDKGNAGADGATGAAGITGATGPQGQKGESGSDATIANAGDNRVVTSDGTVGGLYAESNFTYTDTGGGQFDLYAEDIDFAFGESVSHFRVNSGPHIGTNARLFGVESNDTNYGLPTVIVDPTVMLTDGIDGSWWPVIWDSTNGALGYQVSSRQFKRDIQPIDINIDLLFDKVNAVEYKFIDDDSDRVQVGFIAEEVEEWDPRFVLHDAEGNPRSLDYGRMVPALFEAIKDLRARIEILENKNN